jgi:hypothetical protein
MNKNKENKQMKRLWLIGSITIAIAFNLAVSLSYFWKPTEIEHPIVCFIIWAITEAYILLFLYVNAFNKRK